MASLAASLEGVLGQKLQSQATRRVHGGSINECYEWQAADGSIFVKVSAVDDQAMFAAEAEGLEELRQANAVRVPAVRGSGATATQAWLALEWLELDRGGAGAGAALGEKLAIQHRHTAAAFGWRRDNTIGSTPQLNGWLDDWVTFWRERRLRYQLDLAADHGRRLQVLGNDLLERMAGLFADYHPAPSLLHGDLWGGNWATAVGGEPVIFDPAVYYGDREADLAMTHLFGGFGADFYAGYAATWPLDAGARVRQDLYNFYHVLNHLNLFGAGYLAQAISMAERLLAHLK
jgi:protein-ribulosamine 3-kinase